MAHGTLTFSLDLSEADLDLRIRDGRVEYDSEVEVRIDPSALVSKLDGGDAEHLAEECLDEIGDDAEVLKFLNDYFSRTGRKLKVVDHDEE